MPKSNKIFEFDFLDSGQAMCMLKVNGYVNSKIENYFRRMAILRIRGPHYEDVGCPDF